MRPRVGAVALVLLAGAAPVGCSDEPPPPAATASPSPAPAPTPTAKPKQAFMLFAYPTGVQGNVVSPGVNELIIPNYKQTWASIRKLADAPAAVEHLSFKTWEYRAG